MHERSQGMHNVCSNSIIFENKKKKIKWDKFTQKLNPDPLLNPTKALYSVNSEP